MSTASRKNHEAVEYGNADSSSAWPFEPAPGRGDVGGLQRLGVPGHRAGFAGDMEADRELASGHRLRVTHERQRDGVAPHVLAGLDRDAWLAAERHRPVRAGDQRGAGVLQAGERRRRWSRVSCRTRWRSAGAPACPRYLAARSAGMSGRARRPRATGRRISAPAAPTDCRPGRGPARKRPSSSPISRPSARPRAAQRREIAARAIDALWARIMACLPAAALAAWRHHGSAERRAQRNARGAAIHKPGITRRTWHRAAAARWPAAATASPRSSRSIRPASRPQKNVSPG